MTISVKCGGCGKVYKVPDDKAGKRFKCKECGFAIAVRPAKNRRADWDELESASAAYESPQRKKRISSKSGSKRRKNRRRNSPGSNNLLLIGGGVVVLGIVGIVIMLEGGSAPELGDARPSAEPGGNQARQQRIATPEKLATSSAERVSLETHGELLA